MIQQQMPKTGNSASTFSNFVNAFNASQGRVLDLKSTESTPGTVLTEPRFFERLTHETERRHSLNSGEPERTSAVHLQYGLPSNPDKLRDVCRRFVDRASGDQRELETYVKKLNRELKRLESELIVSIRISDFDLCKVELFLTGPNGFADLITKIDRKPLIEKRRAEDIADLLTVAPLNRFTTAAIEGKLREAFVDGGQNSFEGLVQRTNDQLQKDCVEYRLACRKVSDRSDTFGISITIV